jgi:hypothetical protein
MITLFEFALGILLFIVCGTIFLVANYLFLGGMTNEKKCNSQPMITDKEYKL